jgi:lipid A disaccharide synthetase
LTRNLTILVLERQRQCEAALVILGQRRREVEEQSTVLESSAKQLTLEEAAVQQLARLAHAAMDEASPALEDVDMVGYL